ncbi:putative F-box protein At3g52320 [Silene latifolia]|uniref:putative F-box protein At3g52320 n=1 Tax=Silene latifolia TaxID=37657 RepID=UPI003D76A44C
MNVEREVKGRVKRQKCNTRNTSNADIPEEIQIDILSRLPPKSLSRCKCVSKHWKDTLTIQVFLLKHSRSYDKHPKLAFVEHSTCWRKDSVISYELNDDNTPKITITSVAKKKTTTSRVRGHDVYYTEFLMGNSFYKSNICNDLICLFDPFSTCVGLLNLKTRDFIRLPAITTAITTKPVDLFRFWYALGFDPVHKVFKILCSIYQSGSKECTTKAAILTVGSKYWNPVDLKSLPSSLIENSPLRSISNSVCLNGVIYWVHCQNTNGNSIVLTVGAFDLNREAFRDNELVTTPINHRRYYLTFLKERPTLLIWKMQYDATDGVEQWTLFNHKNPNASWKKRIFTKKILIVVPYGAQGATIAGGSTLLQYSKWINSDYSWYLLYDLEKFAIEEHTEL